VREARDLPAAEGAGSGCRSVHLPARKPPGGQHLRRPAATSVQAADDPGPCCRSMHLSAGDRAAWPRMREATGLSAADGRGSDPGSMHLSARHGATGSALRSTRHMPSAADPECSGHGVRLSARNSAARTNLRTAEGVQPAGAAQSPRPVRMSAGHDRERKQLYRARASVTRHHHHPARRPRHSCRSAWARSGRVSGRPAWARPGRVSGPPLKISASALTENLCGDRAVAQADVRFVDLENSSRL
jgi:hypothetical protein